MTIQPLSGRAVLLHRVLRVGGTSIAAAVVVVLFAASNRTARVHWLETATTSALAAESAANPNDEELNLVLDQHLVQDGRDEQAYDLMSQLISRFPNSAQCWDHYARASAQTNHVLDALKGYQQEIRIDPGAAAAHAILGTMYIKAGLMSEGLAEIEIATHLHQDAQINVLLWAQALEAEGRNVEAWQCLADSARRDPMQDTLWSTVGPLALKLNRVDEAEAMMIRRINMSPNYNDADARGALAHLMVAVSHDPRTVDEALDVAKLGASYETSKAQAPLAEILIIKRDLKGARAVLEKGLKMDIAIGLKTKNQDCLRMLAEIADSEGRTKDAKKYRAELPPTPTPQLVALRNAATADPAYTPALLAYARALEQFGDYGQAAEVCDQVLALNHDEPEATEIVARCRNEAIRKLDAAEKATAVTSSASINQRAIHAQP